MELREIFRSIDARRPNELSESDKLCFINSTIRLYGSIIGKSTVAEFETNEGQRKYPLPEGVESEGIKSIKVDGEEFTAKRYDERMSDSSFMLDPTGFIFLSGEKGGRKVEILYSSCTPFEGFGDGEEYLSRDCGVYDSYADVLVYGALYQLAEAEEDINAAANYKARMEEVLSYAMQGRYSKKGKYPAAKGAMRKWQRF